MASEFITRVERDKDEPYTVIFHTDDADKYKHIEDECRKMIGHAKPTKQTTVDAVSVVHARWYRHSYDEAICTHCGYDRWTGFECSSEADKKWDELPPYCEECGARMDGSDGERKEKDNERLTGE